MTSALLVLALFGCNGESPDDTADLGTDVDTGVDTDAGSDIEEDSDTEADSDTQAPAEPVALRIVHGSSDAGALTVEAAEGVLAQDLAFGDTAMVSAAGSLTVRIDGDVFTTVSTPSTGEHVLVVGGSYAAATDDIPGNDDRALTASMVPLPDDGLLMGDLAVAGGSWDVRIGAEEASLPLVGGVPVDASGTLTVELVDPVSDETQRRFSVQTDSTGPWQLYATGSASSGLELLVVDPEGNTSLQGGDARVRFVSTVILGADGPTTFDLAINGLLMATDVTFLEPTAWTFAPSGSQNIEVRLAGQGTAGAPLVTLPVLIPEGGSTTLVATASASGLGAFNVFAEGAAPDSVEVVGYIPSNILTNMLVTNGQGRFTGVSGNVTNGVSPVGTLPAWGGPVGLVSGNPFRPKTIAIGPEYAGQRVLIIADPFASEAVVVGADSVERLPFLPFEGRVWVVNMADFHVAFESNQGYDVELRGHASTPPAWSAETVVATNFMPGQVTGPHTVTSGTSWYAMRDTQDANYWEVNSLRLWPSFDMAIVQTGQLGYADHHVALPHRDLPVPADRIKLTVATYGVNGSMISVDLCNGSQPISANNSWHTFAGFVDPAVQPLTYNSGAELFTWDLSTLTPGKSWLVSAHVDSGEAIAVADGEAPQTLVSGAAPLCR